MWPAYLAEYPRLVRPDTTHQCYARRAELAAGDRSRLKDAITLWFNGHDLPSACDALFSQFIREGLINREDVWREAAKSLNIAAAEIPTSTSRGVEKFFDGKAFDPSGVLP